MFHASPGTMGKAGWPQNPALVQQPPFDLSGTLTNGIMLGGLPQEHNWPPCTTSGNFASLGPASAELPHQHSTAMPFTSTKPTLHPKYRYELDIDPLPPKSRVETQIPVKLTLRHMPGSISRIHLQTMTVSKTKHWAKPVLTRTPPDMLELYAMLFCTSAMQDQEKQRQAFARAAKLQPIPTNGVSHSSSSDPSLLDKRDQKPVDGAPVQICGNCIERERKRAARKKTKDPDEDLLWAKDEAKRIIVFNSPEVRELQRLTLPGIGDSTRSNGNIGETVIQENTLEVDLPMRIACYCRHQDEKLGFQCVHNFLHPLSIWLICVPRVIFTLRDHQDNVVAQEITNSIIITDDHKTHPAPGPTYPQGGAFPPGVVVHGAGLSSQLPVRNPRSALPRNAFSTTDLQGIQQLQYQQHLQYQQISPFAIPQNPSHTTSATLTSKTLSRQNSQSAFPGQQSKRRKANCSGRISSGLVMTTMPSQQGTNPETPANLDMENLQGSQSVSSSPGTLSQSSSPSPTSGPQSNGLNPLPPANGRVQTQGLPQSNGLNPLHSTNGMAQTQGLPQNNGLNPLHSANGMAQTQAPPVIHRVTPTEGSKSGGLEVTCLGRGLRQGLEVMFGDAPATSITCWGDAAISCVVPPALQTGIVFVTLRQNGSHGVVPPPDPPATFRYIDDDDQRLIDLALTVVDRKWGGSATNRTDSARNILRLLEPRTGTSSQGGNQERYAPGSNSVMATVMDLETAMLSCLNAVDLDDSPFQASFNAQGNNGQSMLHFSASLGYYRLTAGLLARGANPDIRDNNGLSPMHLASLRGHQQIIRKLRSAGADPTLRSLNGFTPADMTTSHQIRDACITLDYHTRARSAVATPASHLSRANSVMSSKSSHGTHARVSSNTLTNGFGAGDLSDEAFAGAYQSQSMTPAQIFSRSRRNSMVTGPEYLDQESRDNVTPNAAISAWKDHFSAQFQQIQQSVHRTLPALQIPTIPDYQTYPVVRRISSLVPQRNSRHDTSNGSSKLAKEVDYRWWELFSGAAPSPPAYEEIFPNNAQRDMSDKRAAILRTAGDAFMDLKNEGRLDHEESSISIMETVNLGSCNLTKQQREQLRAAHAMKVKKLKSDRNLFFIWVRRLHHLPLLPLPLLTTIQIPLLVLVLVAMLKDRAPRVFYVAYHAAQYARERFQDREVEAV